MQHVHYNKTHFPHFVGNHGNWDIYRNDKDNCAAIPTLAAASQGCQASHFGNMAHVRATLGESWLEQQTTSRLSKAPDIGTTFTLKGSAAGEVLQVVAWLKPSTGHGSLEQSLVCCLQDEATHVWGQSLWPQGTEVNEVVARVADLQVDGVRRVDYWRVREYAIQLAAHGMVRDGVKMPRWAC